MNGPTPNKIRKINFKNQDEDIYQWMSDIKASMEREITNATATLKRELSDIKHQNQVLLEEVAELNVLVQHQIKSNSITKPNLSAKFPLKSVDEVKELDKDIEMGDRASYVKTMSLLLLPGGVGKNLKNIIADEVTMQYNIDGVQGKARLRSLKNFFSALIESISMTETVGSPEEQLRKAMQLQKKRVIKKKKN